MNRRRFMRLVLTGMFIAGAFGFQSAQGQARQPSAGTARQQQRPVAQQMRVEKLPPELVQLLKDWEKATGKFNKLQGEHYRWVYDFVFQVEKRAKGKFWFEAPDKGRIDILPSKLTNNPRTKDKNQKPLSKGKTFAVQPDKEEQWISSGTEVIQVNTEEKTIEVFPIPKALQGEGITNSPLPFLFGMKADKAQRRYRLFFGPLHNRKENHIHLIVYPRLLSDGRNWSKAEVMLDGKTFYPQAIKLIDPGGNSETVYQFSNVGEPNFFAGRFLNPFKVNRPGFKRIVHNLPKPQGVAKNGVRMPRLIGLHWKKTKELLEKAGYTVKLKQGVPARKSEQVYRIYRQSPLPNTPLKKTVPIVLTLYNKKAEATSTPTNRTSAKPSGSRQK